jgi:hypothetical protein
LLVLVSLLASHLDAVLTAIAAVAAATSGGKFKKQIQFQLRKRSESKQNEAARTDAGLVARSSAMI